MEEETQAFAGPVLFIHGDTQHFRVDQPLFSPKTRRPIENFLRLETFGTPTVRWVRVAVDPDAAQPFTFKPEGLLPDP